MASYQPLCRLNVRHRYFSSGYWAGLHYRPNEATARLLHNSDVLLRPSPQGLGLFFDADKHALLSLLAQEQQGYLHFCFHVSAPNRDFETYTQVPWQREQALLVFSNHQQAEQSTLTHSEYVSTQDALPLNDAIAQGLLSPLEARRPPDFVVALSVPYPNQQAAPEFEIHFDTRCAYWHYYLLNSMQRPSLQVLDSDEHIQFVDCGPQTLSNGSPAQLFRSQPPIELYERSPLRFQLRELNDNGPKTLIKRLPVASQARLGLAQIDGAQEVVLECFVNY